MNFRRGRFREEPEINFIPLIDVLLVVLIFLMASTTYSKFTELKISLPEADAEKQVQRPKQITVVVDSTGRFQVNEKAPFTFPGVASLSQNLKEAATGLTDPVVVMRAAGFSLPGGSAAAVAVFSTPPAVTSARPSSARAGRSLCGREA